MLSCGPLNSAHLPVLIAIMCAGTFGATYVMAVYRGEVDPLFPYISDTANGRPESCVFSFMLNAVAFLTVITMYLRYRLVFELSQDSDRVLSRLNNIALAAGCVSCFGLAVLANFQESAVFIVHMTGALTCFGTGVVYSCIQVAITRKMYPLYTGYFIVLVGHFIQVVRVILATLCVGLLIGGIVCAMVARYQFHSVYPNEPVPRPWTGKQRGKAGYDMHIASAICEWVLAILTTSFLLSYSREFEKVRCSIQVQPLVAHLDSSVMEFDNPSAALM